MKAVVKLKLQHGAEILDVYTPEVGHNDTLIKVKTNSICGIDLQLEDFEKGMDLMKQGLCGKIILYP